MVSARRNRPDPRNIHCARIPRWLDPEGFQGLEVVHVIARSAATTLAPAQIAGAVQVSNLLVVTTSQKS